MVEFHLFKNEPIKFLIDSGYYVDYQINKGRCLPGLSCFFNIIF